MTAKMHRLRGSRLFTKTKLLRVPEAALRLDVKEATVRKMILEKRIPTVRIYWAVDNKRMVRKTVIGMTCVLIDQVPAGKYEFVAWQPILGMKEKEITVGAGGKVDVNFEFTPESAQ